MARIDEVMIPILHRLIKSAITKMSLSLKLQNKSFTEATGDHFKILSIVGVSVEYKLEDTIGIDVKMKVDKNRGLTEIYNYHLEARSRKNEGKGALRLVLPMLSSSFKMSLFDTTLFLSRFPEWLYDSNFKEALTKGIEARGETVSLLDDIFKLEDPKLSLVVNAGLDAFNELKKNHLTIEWEGEDGLGNSLYVDEYQSIFLVSDLHGNFQGPYLSRAAALAMDGRTHNRFSTPNFSSDMIDVSEILHIAERLVETGVGKEVVINEEWYVRNENGVIEKVTEKDGTGSVEAQYEWI